LQRKAEEEHRAYVAKVRAERREELAKMKAKAAEESRDELLEIIEGWVTACNIEQFFADLTKVSTLPEEKRALIEQRIQ
jgi:GTP1/Obg family GTP-binding protein